MHCLKWLKRTTELCKHEMPPLCYWLKHPNLVLDFYMNLPKKKSLWMDFWKWIHIFLQSYTRQVALMDHWDILFVPDPTISSESFSECTGILYSTGQCRHLSLFPCPKTGYHMVECELNVLKHMGVLGNNLWK